ncbi:MAG TPA: cytochrome c oxidase subunit 4 [Rugosimonospora sp.]|nr:cytochrome c oxidase subunit 4 [Rugosimonospora sp.]
MKSEYRLFGLLSLFLFAAAVVYWFWTKAEAGQPASGPGGDWIGTTALVLSGLLCLMIATSLFIISRRIDPRPEDRADADMSEGAGEVGFFSPGSYWPFGVALSGAVAGLGMVYWQPWLIGVGIIAVLVTAGGFLFEYYTGSRRTTE